MTPELLGQLRGRGRKDYACPNYNTERGKLQMKTSEIVERLDEVRGVAEESAAFDPVHTEAIDEAIQRLNAPSDRCLANEILLLAGLVLGAVGIISVLCGVIYVLLGNYTAAWAMLPWAITAAVAALLSFAGVRK